MKNMKKLAFSLISLVMFAVGTSCSKDNDEPIVDDVIGSTEMYINTYEKDDKGAYLKKWHYVSAKDRKVIGTGMFGVDDKAWAARTDWDFAIYRLNVKTNSGTSSSVDAKGGLYTFGEDVKYASITSLPSDAEFVADVLVSEPQMGGGKLEYSKSKAQVVFLGAMGDAGPTYDKAPCYVFRSADSKRVYKLDFIQYEILNSENKKETGHIKFNIAEIE